MEVYPDARIIVTKRDPIQAVASYCSLVAVAWGMTSDAVDLKKVADYVLTTAAKSQKIADGALRSIPESQIYHADYSELTRDPAAMVASIYEYFGYDRDDGFGARTRTWLNANPPDRYGRHKYDLADFGLTPQDVRRALE